MVVRGEPIATVPFAQGAAEALNGTAELLGGRPSVELFQPVVIATAALPNMLFDVGFVVGADVPASPVAGSLSLAGPGVTLGPGGSGEISVCQASCSTGALGDVVSRQLEMNAAQMAAHLVVDFECEFQFTKNPIEATRFQAR